MKKHLVALCLVAVATLSLGFSAFAQGSPPPAAQALAVAPTGGGSGDVTANGGGSSCVTAKVCDGITKVKGRDLNPIVLRGMMKTIYKPAAPPRGFYLVSI